MRTRTTLETVRLLVEFEGPGDVREVTGGGEALVAFMSFAVSRGFGATHPLIALADRLHDVHHVRMGPLTTFYDADVEDAEDAEKREMSWQPAAELDEALATVEAAIAGDEQCRQLLRRADAETLPAEVASLRCLLTAAKPGSRVRLGYRL